MVDFDQIRKTDEVIAAAVYIAVINMIQEEAERVIAAQLQQIYAFADHHDIVIVESYIERNDPMSEWNRLLENCGRYRVVLHCGGIGSNIQKHATDIINVTMSRLSETGINVIGK
ncbi:hypothetical protein [uncultured Brevibacillus sp.]|uniref:hypothetical protein n=1 Tax=uncultured Brevibacillus sp. TaxID=169970 RepID=UPI002593B4DA|nr:hypothetical protein [uncultured Brevibacillus sp.]